MIAVLSLALLHHHFRLVCLFYKTPSSHSGERISCLVRRQEFGWRLEDKNLFIQGLLIKNSYNVFTFMRFHPNHLMLLLLILLMFSLHLESNRFPSLKHAVEDKILIHLLALRFPIALKAHGLVYYKPGSRTNGKKMMNMQGVFRIRKYWRKTDEF